MTREFIAVLAILSRTSTKHEVQVLQAVRGYVVQQYGITYGWIYAAA